MPIELFSHDPGWRGQAARLIEDLAFRLGALADRFDHVGSTAVPGLAAKPKLHIDVTLAPGVSPETARNELLHHGYADLGHLYRDGELHLTRQAGESFGVWAFEGAGTIMAHRVCVCRRGCSGPEERRRFREALLQNKELASEYQRLKQQLVRDFGGIPDWKKYTSGKTAFITGVLAISPGDGKKTPAPEDPVAGAGAN